MTSPPAIPSRKAIDRLGEELRRAAEPSPEALGSLRAWRDLHEAALGRVEAQLRRELGVQPSSRLKTTLTIVDKLRRMPDMQLSRMQDLAGTRVTADINLADQDALAAQVVSLFSPEARMVDRRAKPSHGYRAIHIVAKSDGVSVEVQVRTALQSLWAMTTERFAALWGRAIQYGEPPRDADAPAIPGSAAGSPTRAEVIAALREWSVEIERVELARTKLQTVLRLQMTSSSDAGESSAFECSPTYADVDRVDSAPEEFPSLVLLRTVAGALPC